MRGLSGAGRRGWGAALLLAVAVIALDQLSKAIIRTELQPGERIDLALGIDLTLITNEGIAFGFLGDGGTPVLVVTVAAMVGMLAWFATAPSRPGLWIAVGLLLGGAIGNLIDRLRIDGVTDFIDPPAWPAFNLADVAITLGAFALVIAVLWGDGDKSRDTPGA